MQTLALLSLCVLCIWAQTPHPTKEPNEREGVGFVYNGRSHHLIIKVQNAKHIDCYIITLSDAERSDVHTDAGMRTLEAIEPNEYESIAFIYNRLSHNLIIKIKQSSNHWICYVMTLTDTERHQVHTDDGIKAVELKYFAMLTITHMVPASQIRPEDVKLCGHPRNGTVKYYSM